LVAEALTETTIPLVAQVLVEVFQIHFQIAAVAAGE
jgi:hypothetical protein